MTEPLRALPRRFAALAPSARPWVLALAFTLLNAVKPPAVDDPAYLRQAAWWAAHPFDPLGGAAPFYQSMVPAAEVASPPVGIAWLAIGTALTGGSPATLKLWLLPWALLLAWALDRLLRRVAPEAAGAWLAATILSPFLLPSFGFMLEVPMLALSLASLAVFAQGAGPGAAVGAGLLAGLALQAKYSAAPLLAALLATGLASRRGRDGLVAIATALGSFALLEFSLRVGAGASPLLAYLGGREARDPSGHAPLATARRLLAMAGTAAPAWIPLGLTALGVARPLVWVALAAVAAGFALLAWAPAGWVAALDRATSGRIVNFENVAIGWMGPVLGAIALVAAVRAWRARDGGAPAARALAAWLALECALAPFVSASASVRRVLGALVALTLLLARACAEVVRREPARRAELAAGMALSVLLGLAFWGSDVDSALADRRVLARLEHWRREAHARGATLACVGDHWGSFELLARDAGMRRVTVGDAALRTGDLLVVPFTVGRRRVTLERGRLALLDSIPLEHRGPLTTRASFYDGRFAIRRPDPAWVGARLWRVTADGEVLRPR